MADAPQQGPQLMIRRGKKVTEGVAVQSIFADIKGGKLKPSNEFSKDGENWRRLDQHPQLARLFAQVSQVAPEKKSKKGLVFFLLLILGIAGAAGYFHPYWAFFNVQTAAEFNNKMKLEQWVNKSSLAQDITGQVNVIWNEVSARKIAGTPNERAAKSQGRAQVDIMLKDMFTSEAVIAYSQGKLNFSDSGSKGAPADKEAPPAKDPFANLGLDVESAEKVYAKLPAVISKADLHYADMNILIASIRAVGGKTINFKYERQGMDWKVVGIKLPPESLRASIEGIAQSALDNVAAKARKSKKGKSQSNKSKSAQVAKAVSSEKSYMTKNIAVQNLAVGKGKKYQYGSPNPGVFATLVNRGNKVLNEVEVTIYFFNSKGAIVSEKKLYPVSTSKYRPGRDNDPMNPKSNKRIGYLVKDFAPKSWGGKITLKVTKVVLKGA